MFRYITIALFLVSFVHAQTRPSANKKNIPNNNKKTIALQDTLKKDTVKVAEAKLPREFMVYTKAAKGKKERTKLCINFVCKDTVLNYCMNDSLCKYPEVSKVLFEQRQGDTLYVLVYIQAFTKVDPSNDDGRCNAGKEIKLVYARWNTKTNTAKFKQKNISSCLKGITNMSKEPVDAWDGSSVLMLSYHRASTFYEVKFDPEKYLLGFQSNNNSESEAK